MKGLEKRRVAITGLGMATPVGIGKEPFWNALISGKSGIKPIRGFDTSFYQTTRGGEIQDFNPTDYLTDLETATLDRVSHFAVASTNMAIEDSNLELCCIDFKKAGIILGTSTAANQSSYHGKWIKEGFNSIQYSDILKYKPETTVDYLALKYGLKGRTALFVNT